MADHAPEELDEFFDFTRLEADMNDELAQCQPPVFPSIDATCSGSLETHAAMEWEPTISEAPIVLDASYLEPFQLSSGCDISQPGTASIPTAPHWQQQSPEQNESVIGMLPPVGIATVDEMETEMAASLDYVSPNHVIEPPLAKHTTPRTPREKPRRLPLRPEADNRKPASAKHKGPSSRIPLEARQMLEDEFLTNPYPCSWEIDIIAHQASLDAKRVRNWFNNARARKKVQSETASRPLLRRLTPLQAIMLTNLAWRGLRIAQSHLHLSSLQRALRLFRSRWMKGLRRLNRPWVSI